MQNAIGTLNDIDSENKFLSHLGTKKREPPFLLKGRQVQGALKHRRRDINLFWPHESLIDVDNL